MAKTLQERQEFGQKLQSEIDDRNWSQADLVREVQRTTGTRMGRDAVSTYINGRSYPTPASLGKLCKALGVSPASLTESRLGQSPEVGSLIFEMRTIGGGQAHVRLEGVISFAMATEISQLLLKSKSTT